MLTGQFKVALDDKGRLAIPQKIRGAIMAEKVVITYGFDKCLWLFECEEWEALSAKLLNTASPFSQKNRLVLRRFIAPSQEAEFDKAGRLSVPLSAREYAGLTKECILLGVSKYIEVWDSAIYKEYLAKTQEDFVTATEELKLLSF